MQLRALVALAFAACGASTSGPPHITDGVRLTYSIAEGAPADAAQAMNRRLARARIKGWASAQDGRIVVDLAAADPERLETARALLARTARFQLHVVDDGAAEMTRLAGAAASDPAASAAGVSAGHTQWRTPAGEARTDDFLEAADREESVDVPTAQRLGCYPGHLGDGERVRCRITGRAAIEQYVADAVARDPALALPGDHRLVYEHDTRRRAVPRWRTYYVPREPVLNGDAIAGARRQRAPVEDRGFVVLTLTDRAAGIVAALTATRAGRPLALVVDDRVVSAPIVMEPVRNGRLHLDDLDLDEAATLAIALASGPLPGPVVLETASELKGGQIVAPPP